MKDKVVGLITFSSAERQCFNYYKDNFKDADTAYIKGSSILTKKTGLEIMGGNPYEIYEKFDSYVVVNVQAKNSMGGYGSELIKCPLVDNRFDRAFAQSLDMLQHADDLYKQGEKAKALPIFQSFAEHSNPEAQYRLGYMYNTINFSNGVPWDNSQAIYWYNKAAEQGNADAQIDLVVMYSNGATKNDTKSVYWRNRLEENVGINIIQRANAFYNTFKHSNFLRAFALYQHLAEHGDARAQYRLGYMYYQGWGVDKDHTQAIYWYKKAADQGDDAAKQSLKELNQ
jgi:TPR repeat protein